MLAALALGATGAWRLLIDTVTTHASLIQSNWITTLTYSQLSYTRASQCSWLHCMSVHHLRQRVI